MPKKIDPTPIQVERSRKTQRYELILNNAGDLEEILAHRFLVTTQPANGGSDASAPIYVGVVRVAAANVPNAVKNRIPDIESLVDLADVEPASLPTSANRVGSGR